MDKKIKKSQKVSVKVSEGEVDILGTVFSRIKKDDFTHRAKLLQALVVFLLDNYDVLIDFLKQENYKIK